MIFKQYCKSFDLPEPVSEFRFHDVRYWRLDYAWPDHKLALEVEGGLYKQGRHNRASGFIKDMEKYNELACMGWRLIRVQPKELNTLNTLKLIERGLGLCHLISN